MGHNAFLMQSASAPVVYAPVVPVSLHGTLAVLLLSVGFVLTALFCTSLTSFSANTKKPRSLIRELAMSAVASVLLGVGTVFLFLWAGIWV